MWVCFGFPGHFSCHYMIHRLIGCLIKAMVSQAKLLQFKGTNFFEETSQKANVQGIHWYYCMPHYSEGTNPQRFRCALSKSQHPGSLRCCSAGYGLCSAQMTITWSSFFPLTKVYKSGILGFEIVMEALRIILTLSPIICFLSF